MYKYIHLANVKVFRVHSASTTVETATRES